MRAMLTTMSGPKPPKCIAADAIREQVEWINATDDLPAAIEAVMNLAGTVDKARTAVVDAKAVIIRRASNEGYSVKRIAEMMGVSPGYVQRLKTQRG